MMRREIFIFIIYVSTVTLTNAGFLFIYKYQAFHHFQIFVTLIARYLYDNYTNMPLVHIFTW